LASARLARSAPKSFEDFLGAFSAYAARQASNCIMSPVETLQVNQGRAQAASVLLTLLKDCVATADKLEDRK